MLKKFLFPLLILTLLITGCGAAQMSEPDAMPSDEMVYYEGGVTGIASEDRAAQTSNTAGLSVEPLPQERLVIREAVLAIIALEPAETMDEIAQMAESMGGYVVASNVYQRTLSSGARVPQASITVRVPVERLDEALEQIRVGALEIENQTISGQDVTQEYTDLQSQLRNLEAAEAQLMEIMEGATRTEDVLAIYNELVYKREQIEIIKGRMQYYKQAAALSKIEVSITADEAAQPIQVGGWQPTGIAKNAIETLIQTLQFLAGAAIWLVLCVLPIALLIGLPLYFAGRAVARARKRRKAAEQAAETLPDEQE